jgi:hypothetical protein
MTLSSLLVVATTLLCVATLSATLTLAKRAQFEKECAVRGDEVSALGNQYKDKVLKRAQTLYIYQYS